MYFITLNTNLILITECRRKIGMSEINLVLSNVFCPRILLTIERVPGVLCYLLKLHDILHNA